MLQEEAREALKFFEESRGNTFYLQYFANTLGGYILSHPNIDGHELSEVKKEIEEFCNRNYRNINIIPPVLEGIRATIEVAKN